MTNDLNIPFHRPYVSQQTQNSVQSAVDLGAIQGGGPFTRVCREELESIFGTKVLLTNSATAALEMAVRLCDIGPGDEVIVPDYTFPSSAAAIALTGATPVFVDVQGASLNIDIEAARRAITEKTKAIMVVHYGGVAAGMEALEHLARSRNIDLLEDAAQCFGVVDHGRHLGSIGRFGAVSFHGTKNIQCGEGGALFIRDEADFEKAEVILEKGTNRNQFLRGEVDKYTWQMLGSSYLPSELAAAYLVPQVREYEDVNKERVKLWKLYKQELDDWAEEHRIRLVSEDYGHLGNGHIFALVFPNANLANEFRVWMAKNGVQVVGHYQALHQSPAGLRFGRPNGKLTVSRKASAGLIRLPMHTLAQNHGEKISGIVKGFLQSV